MSEAGVPVALGEPHPRATLAAARFGVAIPKIVIPSEARNLGADLFLDPSLRSEFVNLRGTSFQPVLLDNTARVENLCHVKSSHSLGMTRYQIRRVAVVRARRTRDAFLIRTTGTTR